MSALQLTSERYAPASSTSAPASWARLPHPVKQAIYVAPDSAWLLGSSSLSCCASHDLSACAMLRPGLTEGTIIAGAPAAWPAATAALASQNSLEFATCVGCQCTWSNATAREVEAPYEVHGLALATGGRAYIAASTGLLFAEAGGRISPVPGVPAGVPYYAVATAPAGS